MSSLQREQSLKQAWPLPLRLLLSLEVLRLLRCCARPLGGLPVSPRFALLSGVSGVLLGLGLPLDDPLRSAECLGLGLRPAECMATLASPDSAWELIERCLEVGLLLDRYASTAERLTGISGLGERCPGLLLAECTPSESRPACILRLLGRCRGLKLLRYRRPGLTGRAGLLLGLLAYTGKSPTVPG